MSVFWESAHACHDATSEQIARGLAPWEEHTLSHVDSRCAWPKKRRWLPWKSAVGQDEVAHTPKIHALFQNTDTSANLYAAFDRAWQIMKTANPALANGPLTVSAQDTLAFFIVEQAQRGI